MDDPLQLFRSMNCTSWSPTSKKIKKYRYILADKTTKYSNTSVNNKMINVQLYMDFGRNHQLRYPFVYRFKQTKIEKNRYNTSKYCALLLGINR